MKLGPARANLIATSAQVQLNNFTAETLNGHASGNATIARTKTGASRVSTTFDNFDVPGLIALRSGRVGPLAGNAPGKAELAFTGTDLSTIAGSIDEQLSR